MEIKKIALDHLDLRLIKYLQQNFADQATIYVSHGWIDAHLHLFKQSKYHISLPNLKKIKGLVAGIDAGSTGLTNIDLLWKQKVDFKLFAWLNIAEQGINNGHELKNLSFNLTNHLKTLAHPNIVGSKVRLSKQVVDGDHHSYRQPLASLAKASNKPIMFHVGNMTNHDFDYLLKNLRPSDTITHFYHGKNQFIYQNLKYLINQKIIRDVGWGAASFSFRQARKMFAQNIYPHIISSDAHDANLINPHHRLNYYMSFFLAQGMSLKEVIKCVTINPYQAYLQKTNWAYNHTYTFFVIRKANVCLTDAQGQVSKLNKLIIPLGVMKEGEIKLC